MSIMDKPQWQYGLEVADFLDAYFVARGWQVTPTTAEEERILCLGDRHFRKPGITTHLYVEYKSGLQTTYTGNVFLETVSVDTADKPGWVLTCQADYLMYAILPMSKVLVFKPRLLREQLDELRRKFKEVATNKHQNDGYNTWGLLVPLAHAEKHLATKAIFLK